MFSQELSFVSFACKTVQNWSRAGGKNGAEVKVKPLKLNTEQRGQTVDLYCFFNSATIFGIFCGDKCLDGGYLRGCTT